MYSAKKQTKPNEPGSPAVNYFRHFPTSFLKPYGMADDAPSEDVVMRRLSSINCEWLRRPQTGVSEFAETFQKNLEFLAENHSSYLRQASFKSMKDHLANFTDVVKKLNTKNADQDPASPDDVKQFLKGMLTENEEQDKFFQDMVKFGGAMYLLGTHYTVIKTLLNNPDAYASKGLEAFCPEMVEFKGNPTVKGMRTLLTKTCATTSAAVKHRGAKRDLAALLESSDDEEDDQQAPPPAPAPATINSKGKKHKKSKKTH
jgi:hypothetical protein